MNCVISGIIFSVLAQIMLCTATIYHRNVPITGCPKFCICENAFCRQAREDSVIRCTRVQVSCVGIRNLTDIPAGIPANVSGLRLTQNNFQFLDMDNFVNFTRLSDLMLDDNNIEFFQLTQALRRLKRLSLKNNRLTTLPRKNLTRLRNLEMLSLQNNSILKIRGVRFPKRIDLLDLSENRLASLPSDLFPQSPNLRVLKLNDNSVLYMHNDAFVNVPHLEVLDVANNKIRVLQRESLTMLPYAWYVNFRNNSIITIHKQAFRLFGAKNAHHHQIDLRDNKIRFLSIDDLRLLIERKKAYSITLEGNPIFCDCNLLKLRDEAGPMMADTGRMVCDGPPENVGRRVNRLNIEDCCF